MTEWTGSVSDEVSVVWLHEVSGPSDSMILLISCSHFSASICMCLHTYVRTATPCTSRACAPVQVCSIRFQKAKRERKTSSFMKTLFSVKATTVLVILHERTQLEEKQEINCERERYNSV